MESTLINTAEDLAAIEGTPAHAAFMGQLAGSLWRLEKDDSMGIWKAIEDNSTVERFGFTRSNFPNAAPLTLPVYVAPPSTVPQSVTRRQAKQALILQGLISGVQPAIDAIQGATQRSLIQCEWDDSQVFERNRPALIMLGTALGLDSAALDALFVTAAAL